MFAFILPTNFSFSPTQPPAVCVNMANYVCTPLPTPLFYRGIISRYALWRKALHFIFLFTSSSPISPLILSDRQCLHFFFLYSPSTATFTIQYQPPTFSPQAITTMVSKVTTSCPKFCSRQIDGNGYVYTACLLENLLTNNSPKETKHIFCSETSLLTRWTSS